MYTVGGPLFGVCVTARHSSGPATPGQPRKTRSWRKNYRPRSSAGAAPRLLVVNGRTPGALNTGKVYANLVELVVKLFSCVRKNGVNIRYF